MSLVAKYTVTVSIATLSVTSSSYFPWVVERDVEPAATPVALRDATKEIWIKINKIKYEKKKMYIFIYIYTR